MVLSGTLDEISQARQKQNFLKIRLTKPFPHLEKIISSIPALSQFEDTNENGTEARAGIDGGEMVASKVLALLVEAGVPVSGFAIEKTRVEDLFLELESQPARKGDQP